MNIISSFFSNKASKTKVTEPVAKSTKLAVPEDSMLKRHFLTQLRADIENSMMPSLADPNLKHYYEASVAAEFQKRLSEVFK